MQVESNEWLNNRFWRQLSALMAILLTFAGCSADPAHHSATTSTSGDVHLYDARPLDDLETDSDNVQVTLTDKLAPPQAALPVYFGEADAFGSEDDTTPVAALPVIALHLGDQWKAVPVTGPGLTDAGWKYVGSGPAAHEVWGVLDTTAGDDQPDFVIAHSTDGALTFTLKEFHKPCRLAEVSDFSMSRAGHGEVTLSLDTDCGSNKAGLYHYETIDHGKTWSRIPRYEPDAMVRAETVPDDEQPQPGDKPVWTLYVRRSPTVAGSEVIRIAGSSAKKPGSSGYARTGVGKIANSK